MAIVYSQNFVRFTRHLPHCPTVAVGETHS
ncbi:hypothetical protein CCACVL1_06532 [Corchorus capsularis]|uniref:Uncharacterized protein n=1 Tax=Corchorus capsularis TaxID=210143 RepID=A0A1R3JEU8_COCAP|nr:hypothetical protein CCACVL1_06532 [Corchorus capsularis]